MAGRSGFRRVGTAAIVAASLVTAAPVTAEEPPRTIEGPVTAQVLDVRDGDTIEVEAFIWPMQSVHVAVRLSGIDAPEKRGACEAEKDAAKLAADRLRDLVSSGTVTLTRIKGDKYFGRVLARVGAPGEPDVAGRLLKEGYVVPYGGRTRRDWCTELSNAAGATARG